MGSAVVSVVVPYVGKRGGAVPRPFLVRFAEKIDQSGGLFECWPWRGGITSEGYGVMWDGTRLVGAHRLSYEMAVGPIPAGLTLDHTCHAADGHCRGLATCPHRRCCNPAHLEAVTNRENIRRAWAAKRARIAVLP